MKVDQTIFFDDPERLGNCLPACVASYLGVGLDEVPHFIEHGDALDGIPREQAMDPELKSSAWWAMWIGFMAGRGFWPLQLESVDQAERGELVFVMGMSPRGVCHQVLYRDGELWHDPHPSRSGVIDVREVLAWRRLVHDHEPTPTVSDPSTSPESAAASTS